MLSEPLMPSRISVRNGAVGRCELPGITFSILHGGESCFAMEDGVFGAVKLFARVAVGEHAGLGGGQEVEVLLEVCAVGVGEVGVGSVAASELVGELEEAVRVIVHGEAAALGGEFIAIDVG